jgi:cytoskeletal protein RodZ
VVKKTVGQVLRDERAKLDMTLNEAEELTHIQKMYIVALEQDDYDALPGDFYVKAYLKQYADRLNLDYDRLLTAYETGRMVEVREQRETTDFADNYRFVKPSERLAAEADEVGEKTWRHYLPIVLLGTVATLIVISISAAVILNKPASSQIADNLYRISTSTKSTTSSSSVSQTSSTSASKVAEPPNPVVTVTGSGQVLVATVKNAPNPAVVNMSVANGGTVWIGMTNSDLPSGQVTLTEATPTKATLTGHQTVLTLGRTIGLTVKIGETPIDLSSISAPESPATLTITIE